MEVSCFTGQSKCCPESFGAVDLSDENGESFTGQSNSVHGEICKEICVLLSALQHCLKLVYVRSPKLGPDTQREIPRGKRDEVFQGIIFDTF